MCRRRVCFMTYWDGSSLCDRTTALISRWYMMNKIYCYCYFHHMILRSAISKHWACSDAGISVGMTERMYRFSHYSLLSQELRFLKMFMTDVLRTFNLGYSVCPKCRPTLFRCEVAVVVLLLPPLRLCSGFCVAKGLAIKSLVSNATPTTRKTFKQYPYYFTSWAAKHPTECFPLVSVSVFMRVFFWFVFESLNQLHIQYSYDSKGEMEIS